MSFCALTGPAWADARSDVLSAAQRCAGITTDRSWLDCYYGAAQPMRSQLGLPPAPASQIGLVPPIGAGYMPQPSYPPLAAAPLGTGLGLAEAPRVAAAPAGPPPMPRRRNDGFMSSIFGSSRAVVSNLRMTSYAVDRGGEFSVTLSDGEVWAQDRGDSNKPDWRKDASRYVVNIYEGALNTYNLETNEDTGFFKVHRVK